MQTSHPLGVEPGQPTMGALTRDPHLRCHMSRWPTSRADPAHQLDAGVECQTSISVGHGDLRLG